MRTVGEFAHKTDCGRQRLALPRTSPIRTSSSSGDFANSAKSTSSGQTPEGSGSPMFARRSMQDTQNSGNVQFREDSKLVPTLRFVPYGLDPAPALQLLGLARLVVATLPKAGGQWVCWVHEFMAHSKRMASANCLSMTSSIKHVLYDV